MKIPNWISKVADEGEVVKEEKPEEHSEINFNSNDYGELCKGELSPEKAAALEQVKELICFLNMVVDKLKRGDDVAEDHHPKEAPAMLKEAANNTKQMPNLGPPLPNPVKEDQGRGQKSLPPAKIKEPETTKWKEIRFNKRTGTWQVVITTRHVRNFLSENEAIDFTKKAQLEKNAINVTQMRALLAAWSRRIDNTLDDWSKKKPLSADDATVTVARFEPWLLEMKESLDTIINDSELAGMKKEAYGAETTPNTMLCGRCNHYVFEHKDDGACEGDGTSPCMFKCKGISDTYWPKEKVEHPSES